LSNEFRPVSGHLRDRPEAPWALWAGIAGALAVAGLSVKGIQSSGSSTAAIGYLYLPLVAIFAAIPIALWGAALGHVVLRLRGAVQGPRMMLVAALAVAASLPVLVAYQVHYGLGLETAVHEVRAMDVMALDRAYEQSRFRRDRYFLAAIAQNPLARPGLLARIAADKDAALHEPLGSLWDVMGENRKGLAVMRLVARHPNTRDETLAKLADGPHAHQVAHELAANPNTPAVTLERWYDSPDYLIEWGLAVNPKTPQRVLARLAVSQNVYTRLNLTYNPATPRELLDRLAADADESVARNAKQAVERRKGTQ
jgi:hypothetical protein